MNIKLTIITTMFFLISCTKSKDTVAKLPQSQTDPASEETNNNPSKQSVKKSLSEQFSKSKSQSPRISGIIQAKERSMLSFQATGSIKDIYFKSGDFVKKDTVIARLDQTNINLDLQKFELDLKSKQLIFEHNKKKLQRFESLFKNNTISPSVLEDTQQEYKIAQLDYNIAELNLKLKKSEQQHTYLKAPYDGYLTKSYKSLGDFITPGVSVFEMVESQNPLVYAQFPASYFDQMKVGMKLKVFNPLNKTTDTLILDKVVPVIDTQTRTFDVYGKIEDSTSLATPGMYVEIILD